MFVEEYCYIHQIIIYLLKLLLTHTALFNSWGMAHHLLPFDCAHMLVKG